MRTAAALASALDRAAALEAALETDARLVLRRFAESARDSAMLTVQVRGRERERERRGGGEREREITGREGGETKTIKTVF